MDKITHEARRGTVFVRFGYYALTAREALAFAQQLQDAAFYAEDLPLIHEKHVDLLASCALCRDEAGPQPDRLTYDEEDLVDVAVLASVGATPSEAIQWVKEGLVRR